MNRELALTNLFKKYAKTCYPILFFVLAMLAILMLSYNSIISNVINLVSDHPLQKVYEINYEFIGVNLLNFITFMLSAVVPIMIALCISNYDDNKNDAENSLPTIDVFTSKVIFGSLFIVLPFLANALMYIILIWGGFFGTFQSDVIVKLILVTLLGIAFALLIFMLITLINLSIKNSVIDSLLTLSIALLVIQIFYTLPISPIFLVAIIIFVFLALLYLGYTLSKTEKAKH